jgi:SAM-dependent methyltransferase
MGAQNTAESGDIASTRIAARARRFLEALSRTRRQEGIASAVALVASLTIEIMQRPVTRRRDERFDRRLGVCTQRGPGQPQLPAQVAAASAYGDGVAYAPTPGYMIQKVLRAMPISTPDAFTFVDLGCGKGRTLLLAAEHGYGRVIGVDLDPDLVDAARRNVEAFEANTAIRPGVIKIFHGDAAGFTFPPDATVVFLFNPFGEETLRAVIGEIENSLRQAPRPFFIAYYNPTHHDVLDASHMFRRITKKTQWYTYEAVDTSRN